MNELPPLPDDVRALLDAAEAGAPPPPVGIEAAVLAKVTASVAVSGGLASLPFVAALGKPLAAVALAVGIGGAGIIAINQARAPTASALVPSSSAVPVPAFAPTIAPAAAGAPAVGAIDVDTERAIDVDTGRGLDIADARGADAAPAADAADAARAAEAQAAHAANEALPVKPKRAVVADDAVAAQEEARASERKLLEEAREALARGDGDRALTQLQQQARLFPRGRLQEERRALTVVAFATRGDRARAHAAARAFEREHPSSLFLEMVRAAVVDDDAP